jgi:D-serine deaminase-like pyridoxal phosphate-dependent protein
MPEVSLAPHGKTTMSPQIWKLQLAAGAWAITVATPWQARAAATIGVPRIIIANQIVDDAGLAWLASVIDARSPEIIVQVDSVAGVERMSRGLGTPDGRLPVLVEVGVAGGRTGVRSASEAAAVIEAVEATPSLELAGVTCFEGVVTGTTVAQRLGRVQALLAMVREVGELVAIAAARDGAKSIILSGGGSVDFPVVAEELSRPLPSGRAVRVIIRSGCTVTHDHGTYEARSPFGDAAPPDGPRLRGALEVWAAVLSTPEPGLALAGAGRRDLSYDAGMPCVLKLRREDGSVAKARGMTVTALNDQHAYLAVEGPEQPAVGDLICFGISHPCSAFDRWRSIPVVDAGYDVIDVYETLSERGTGLRSCRRRLL